MPSWREQGGHITFTFLHDVRSQKIVIFVIVKLSGQLWTKITVTKCQELMILRSIWTPHRELIPSRGLCQCLAFYVRQSCFMWRADRLFNVTSGAGSTTDEVNWHVVTDGEDFPSREASCIVSTHYIGQALTGEGKTPRITDFVTRMYSRLSGVLSPRAKPSIPSG